MTAVLKLYEATDALDVVREWILEHDEEIRAMEGALPDELAALLEQAEGDFKVKAERVGLFIRELLVNAKAVKEEADRLTARAKHYERAAEGLKRYLQVQMEIAGIPKVEGKLCTVRLQKSPPSLNLDPEVWTQDYLKKLYELDPDSVRFSPAVYAMNAAKILELAKFPDGKGWKYIPPLEGMSIEQGQHIRIR